MQEIKKPSKYVNYDLINTQYLLKNIELYHQKIHVRICDMVNKENGIIMGKDGMMSVSEILSILYNESEYDYHTIMITVGVLIKEDLLQLIGAVQNDEIYISIPITLTNYINMSDESLRLIEKCKEKYNRRNMVTRKSVYDRKRTRIYIIKCWSENEMFYKIGKTKNTIDSRFSGKKAMPYNYEIMYDIHVEENLLNKLEKDILKSHSKYTYNPSISFSGSAKECFYEIDTEAILNLKEKYEV